jgi:hypothetical protein
MVFVNLFSDRTLRQYGPKCIVLKPDLLSLNPLNTELDLNNNCPWKTVSEWYNASFAKLLETRDVPVSFFSEIQAPVLKIADGYAFFDMDITSWVTLRFKMIIHRIISKSYKNASGTLIHV